MTEPEYVIERKVIHGQEVDVKVYLKLGIHAGSEFALDTMSGIRQVRRQRPQETDEIDDSVVIGNYRPPYRWLGRHR